MSASCITGPVGTPGGTRTRRTEILRFRCLPFASREHLVEPAGFEPALSCTSSKSLLPVGLWFHEFQRAKCKKTGLAFRRGRSCQTCSFELKPTSRTPGIRRQAAAHQAAAGRAITQGLSSFAFAFLSFSLSGKRARSIPQRFRHRQRAISFLHGWLRESDSNRCASGYEPAAGAAPVHPAIFRTTY